MAGHIAFHDFPVFENHQADKITCMATMGKKLVVGTEKGFILIYEFTPKDDPRKGFRIHIGPTYKEFSQGKSIDQIDVIEIHNVLLLLSDGLVTVHSLPQLNKICTLTKWKGTLFYSVDNTNNNLKIVLVQKKKLIILDWTGFDFVVKRGNKDGLTVPDQVKTCVWCGENALIIGLAKKEYDLINISTGEPPSELFSTANPLATVLPGNQILLQKDNISVFVGHDGKPTQKYGLTWTEPPEALGCSYPYVIALLPRSVEAQLIFGGLQQSFSLPSGVSCITIASDGVVYLANKVKNGTIWRLTPVLFTEQVDSLQRNGQYSDALRLCKNLDKTHIPDKEERLARLSLVNAYKEFNDGHYGKAMTTFYESEVDPLKVIALYGNLLPNSVKSTHNKFPIKIAELKGAASNRALLALSSYLEKKRIQLHNQLKKGGEFNAKEQDPDLIQVDWNETTIIDTVLVISYLLTNPTLISNLMKLPNYCHVKQCEANLLPAKPTKGRCLSFHFQPILKPIPSKFTDLILLYRGRGLHQDALYLLAKLAKEKDADYPGTKAAIDYLKTLGKDNLDLLLNKEFTNWVFSQNPIDALQIYTIYRKQPLPAMQVVNHLESMEKQGIIPKIVVGNYLEHIIDEGEQNPEFHNKLVLRYFDIVLEQKREAKRSNPNISQYTAGTEPHPLGPSRAKLIDFLEESNSYTPGILLSRYGFEEEQLHEEKAIILSKIGRHYEALKEYVHNLHDLGIAESYCEKHYNPDNEDGRDVYLHLLRVYLKPPSGADEHTVAEFQDAAFQVLHRHFRKIDVPQALSFLPSSTPISRIYPFLENVLQDINSERSSKLIQLNLQNSERMRVKSELLKIRSQCVTITDETTCDHCHEKIKDSVFSRYPDGSIAHSRCIKMSYQPTEKKYY